ncbi:TNF receptor-associated factor homolog 1a [Ziziphus jujuba]|uniref:TNF receptor-associated factor homolog 1a n=3 Tax=Ziziphus jujuba TaxID=326968 RepID=A0A6P4A407_ZIZJJ|nr:TNF receptor-associated factor homolog 1a [Ziziphus jujuba]XP_015887976.3 TNF receptor-associated factor homolog 1a [Ziziphus jujuba]
MAGIAGEESGAGRSMEGISGGQRCQSGEALAEWRSSEQVENGTPSTSPPYWDTDDDDDGGPKPSDLYGKYTWKIEKFSQINKRELRSNAFEVGGYKWYILIYPQGCDVCNHLSLFLCVANHDKLLPGWSHFAQFTIAVVNKDPKKSKYSDTLHRFWKKEHDWGWKKFMELSKVLDGFIDADTLIIKAQVQVIREKADRPFRCLDCQYRRELVRVYLTNVEQICRRFVEERRSKLGKLIEDKARWSSFCAFWLGIDQNSRRRMSREKTDSILKVVVKHFFIEKEVTSTLVMDSLYSGLKALEGQNKSKKGRVKLLDAAEEMPAPIVRVEKDTFVLVDDVLLLLERAAMEPLPPKDEKGPQNRTKEGNSGEDFNKDSIERDERRLTELGRRTVEIFVLAHIFSNKIEVAYQEAVALKRQEELIREEEAAWQAETEQKAKRGATEKEKKSKKKQAKQKRNNRKGKEKGREERPVVAVQDKLLEEDPGSDIKDSTIEEVEPVLEKSGMLEDVSDVSDSVDGVAEVLQPDSEDRDASPINWDTDTSEVHPPTEASSGISGPSSVLNGVSDKKSTSVMDDSSSTCSTDSVPSVVMNGPYKGNSLPNFKNQKPASRGKNQRGKATPDGNSWPTEMDNQPSVPTVEAAGVDVTGSGKSGETDSEAVLSLQDRIKRLEQHAVKTEEEMYSLKKKLSINKDQAEVDMPPKEKTLAVTPSPGSPPKTLSSSVQPKSEYQSSASVDSVQVRKTSLNGAQQIDRPVSLVTSSQNTTMSKPETPKTATQKPTEKAMAHPIPVMSRPSSAPLIPGPRPTAPVVSMVQTAPLLARSVSAAGRLGPDPSPATHSYVPQSYRNAIMGNHVASSSAGFPNANTSSSGVNQPPAYSTPPALVSSPMFLPQGSERMDPGTIKSGFPFGMMTRDGLHNGTHWMENSQREPGKSISYDTSTLLNDVQNLDIYKPLPSGSREHLSSEFSAGTSGRQIQGVSADEFPHLDIINDLLDDEYGIGKASRGGSVNHLNRQFSFPGELGGASDMGSTSSCRFERTRSYHDGGFQRSYSSSGSPYESVREYVPQGSPLPYVNGQIDGLIQNQWQMANSDLSLLGMRSPECDGYPYYNPEYSNLACSSNGYTVFRPSNGH